MGGSIGSRFRHSYDPRFLGRKAVDTVFKSHNSKILPLCGKQWIRNPLWIFLIFSEFFRILEHSILSLRLLVYGVFS